MMPQKKFLSIAIAIECRGKRFALRRHWSLQLYLHDQAMQVLILFAGNLRRPHEGGLREKRNRNVLL
jgi:hypothetical protein